MVTSLGWCASRFLSCHCSLQACVGTEGQATESVIGRVHLTVDRTPVQAGREAADNAQIGALTIWPKQVHEGEPILRLCLSLVVSVAHDARAYGGLRLKVVIRHFLDDEEVEVVLRGASKVDGQALLGLTRALQDQLAGPSPPVVDMLPLPSASQQSISVKSQDGQAVRTAPQLISVPVDGEPMACQLSNEGGGEDEIGWRRGDGGSSVPNRRTKRPRLEHVCRRPVPAKTFYRKDKRDLLERLLTWFQRECRDLGGSVDGHGVDEEYDQDPDKRCRVFPKQDMAFRHHDACAGWPVTPEGVLRVNVHNEGAGHASLDDEPLRPFTTPLRLFSFEAPSDGRRAFAVSPYLSFVQQYLQLQPQKRHVYEIIRQGYPCRLYVDLEYEVEANQDANGNELVDTVITLIIEAFRQCFDVIVKPQFVLQLDSSTPAKFSRHLIVHLPDGRLFRSTVHAGRFVQKILAMIGPPDKQDSASTSALWMNRSGGDGRPVLFVDTGVYTRNRAFRMLHSCKFGKPACFKVCNTDTFQPPPSCPTCGSMPRTETEDQWVLASLVVPFFPCGHLPSAGLLTLEDDKAQPPLKLGYLGPGCLQDTSRVASSSFHGDNRASPFPAVDSFILFQANEGGVQGTLRSWQYSYGPRPDTAAGVAPLVLPFSILTYNIGKNRFCRNIGRMHKSNGVMLVVDLRRCCYYQKCHDFDCRGYRSPPLPLPPEVAPSMEAVDAVEFDAALVDAMAQEPARWGAQM